MGESLGFPAASLPWLRIRRFLARCGAGFGV